ncbi:hypothetical protein GGI25_001117 [Coemansia spiralis]|uniref:Zn(2)-C6 fungal-type domain-containing protein n=1 Tax=Coemansia spiralis TaxID=417178 RepID=A0A9W8GB30_9FUNG|nr:hypothetical protein GGI25_001117 [Coemansia spiralis]
MSDAHLHQPPPQLQSLSLSHHHQQEQQNMNGVQSPNDANVESVSLKSVIPTAASDSSVTEKKDDKAVPVRKRLSLACTTCRQRKVKCDGGRPACRTCAKFNWPCIYQPSNRKRGPRPRALALMDGSMPYTTRSHWSVPHGYYPPYAIPGRSPMSPPPPPHPTHMMTASNYSALHPPEIPQNGASLRIDPAYHQPGGYNYDSYASYGDYMANTGAIRVRPPPPLPQHYMRSPPGMNPAVSPTSAYHPPRYGGYGNHNHHHPYSPNPYPLAASSYEGLPGQQQQQQQVPLSASPFSLQAPNGSPSFSRPFHGGISDRHGPNTTVSVPPNHYSAHPPPLAQALPSSSGYPSTLPPPAAHGEYVSGSSDPWRPPVHANEMQKHNQGSSSIVGTGLGQNGIVHSQVSPAISAAGGHSDGPVIVSSATVHPAPQHQHTRTHAAVATQSLGSPTPQNMCLSAQSHASASLYAAEMQPQNTAAGTHIPAIYARKKADTIHGDNSSGSTIASLVASKIGPIAGSSGRISSDANGNRAWPGHHPPSLHTMRASSHKDGMPLSSPIQPSRPNDGGAGYSFAKEAPMSVPIPSSSSFGAQPCYSQQQQQPEDQGYAVANILDNLVSPVTASKPLPFSSNGTVRPRLPPLLEVLGKDYHMMMSPQPGDAMHKMTDNTTMPPATSTIALQQTQRMQQTQQTLPPMSSSLPLPAAGVDHFGQTTTRRRDTSRD